MLAGSQRHTMLVGGSRSGKTFLFTRATAMRAIRAPRSRHAILRFRANAAKASISLDTLPKVMRLCFPDVKLRGPHQEGYFTLPNGSEIWVGGLDDKERVERILGQEHATLYFNECSQIPYSSVTVGLTRLAQNVPGLRQRAYYDLNPSGISHWTHRLFLEGKKPGSMEDVENRADYAWAYLNPADNPANNTPEYLRSLAELPERQRKRFLEGVYQPEVEGALWTLETIDRDRVKEAPPLRRIVVAIDPSGAGSQTDRSDAIGIVVAGLGFDGHGYVLADVTCHDGPAVWGRRAVDAYRRWLADRIIGERNFGGAMVQHVIRTTDDTVAYREVTASRGKVVRAEPIAALYETGKVHHVGRLPQLEDQLCAFSTSGYVGDGSPDRADADVWALTDLMLGAGAPVIASPVVVSQPSSFPS